MKPSHASVATALLLTAIAPSSPAAIPLGAEEADQRRIRAHLLRVEQELLASDTSGLPPESAAQRARNIERLRAYRQAGVFPRNDRHAGRRMPCLLYTSPIPRDS